MNKKLISVAVAAAFAAPMAASADATIYGAIDTGVQSTTIKGTAGKSKDNLEVVSYDGALGIKGSEDLGGGLKAIYKLETDFASDVGGGAPTTFTTDEVWVGVAGSFGVAAIGAEDHPYKNVLNASGFNPHGDRLNDLDKGVGNLVGTLGFRQATADNAILYISPDISGFSGQIALVAPEGSGVAGATTNSGFDAYSLGVNYKGGGLKVGLAYEDIDVFKGTNVGNVEAWAIGASYAFGDFNVGGAMEWQENATSTVDEVEAYALSATYTFGNSRVGASFTNETQENYAGAETSDIDFWGLNYTYNFSGRTAVYASYGDAEDDYASATAQEADAFNLGIVHSF